jgi:hypothetical protein
MMTANQLGGISKSGEGARNRIARETNRPSAEHRRDEGGRMRRKKARHISARNVIAAAPAARQSHSGRTIQWMSKP